MKKIFAIVSCVLAMTFATSCDWFELDNQEGYNATIAGTFVDSGTGDAVQSEHATTTQTYTWGSWSWTVTVASGGIMSIYEQGWDSESAQTWNIKNNGTYTNNLAFAGEYKVEIKDANFYPLEKEFTIQKGDNIVDFTVTPFARVKNPQITYDSANHRITAKFGMEYGDPAQTEGMYEARLCIYTDRYVGSLHNYASAGNTTLSHVVESNPTDKVGSEMELWIDTQDTEGSLATEFQYKRPHYVRVAIVAVGKMETSQQWDWSTWSMVTTSKPAGINSSSLRYNYSPVFKIDEDGTVSEVTNW